MSKPRTCYYCGTELRRNLFTGGAASGSPAVSTKAAKSMRETIRRWRLRHCSHQSLEALSRLYNPVIRGWIQYYGRYYRTGLRPVVRQLDDELVQWARQKYKKLRRHVRRARQWVAAVSRRSPELFCERLGVKLPGATLPGTIGFYDYNRCLEDRSC